MYNNNSHYSSRRRRRRRRRRDLDPAHNRRRRRDTAHRHHSTWYSTTTTTITTRVTTVAVLEKYLARVRLTSFLPRGLTPAKSSRSASSSSRRNLYVWNLKRDRLVRIARKNHVLILLIPRFYFLLVRAHKPVRRFRVRLAFRIFDLKQQRPLPRARVELFRHAVPRSSYRRQPFPRHDFILLLR